MTSSVVVEQVAALRARLLEPGHLEQLRITALRDDLVVIALLQVPKPLRRNGIGSQALAELTAAADRHGWILAGTPDTSFGSSRTGLDRLYRRFGFTSNRGRRADHLRKSGEASARGHRNTEHHRRRQSSSGPPLRRDRSSRSSLAATAPKCAVHLDVHRLPHSNLRPEGRNHLPRSRRRLCCNPQVRHGPAALTART